MCIHLPALNLPDGEDWPYNLRRIVVSSLGSPPLSR